MSLVDRVKRILLSPRTEWAVIETEPATVGSLYTSYIIPLAAIPAVAGFIGLSVFGVSVLGTTVRTSFAAGFEGMITRYLLTLGSVYVLGMIIDALAPSFGGTKDKLQALKVATYSATASWVSGIFAMVPGFRWLGILGLYSLYLLYLGLPALMKSPPEKSLGYTIVVIIAEIVVFIVIGLLVRPFAPTAGLGM